MPGVKPLRAMKIIIARGQFGHRIGVLPGVFITTIPRAEAASRSTRCRNRAGTHHDFPRFFAAAITSAVTSVAANDQGVDIVHGGGAASRTIGVFFQQGPIRTPPRPQCRATPSTAFLANGFSVASSYFRIFE